MTTTNPIIQFENYFFYESNTWEIIAKQLPKLKKWEFENYPHFDASHDEDEFDKKMPALPTISNPEDTSNSNATFSSDLYFVASTLKEIQEKHAALQKLPQNGNHYDGTTHASSKPLTLILNLRGIKTTRDIPPNDWHDWCKWIRRTYCNDGSCSSNHRHMLTTLKIFGPLDCFKDGVLIECSNCWNDCLPGLLPGVPELQTISKLQCLLLATPNVRHLHMERIGGGGCEPTFWQIGKTMLHLETIVVKCIDDPHHMECYTTWFAFASSISKLPKLRSVILSQVTFYVDPQWNFALVPPWEFVRQFLAQNPNLSHIEFSKCHSANRPHGSPWPMGMKLAIEFSKQAEEELQFYPRYHLERLHRLVRLMAPEMFSRHSASQTLSTR